MVMISSSSDSSSTSICLTCALGLFQFLLGPWPSFPPPFAQQSFLKWPVFPQLWHLLPPLPFFSRFQSGFLPLPFPLFRPGRLLLLFWGLLCPRLSKTIWATLAARSSSTFTFTDLVLAFDAPVPAIPKPNSIFLSIVSASILVLESAVKAYIAYCRFALLKSFLMTISSDMALVGSINLNNRLNSSIYSSIALFPWVSELY